MSCPGRRSSFIRTLSPFTAAWASFPVGYCSTVPMTLVLRTRLPVTSSSRQGYSHRSDPALRFVHLRQPRWQRCRILEPSPCKMPEGVLTKNLVLFGAVETAKPRSASCYSHDRVYSTRIGSTTRFWRADSRFDGLGATRNASSALNRLFSPRPLLASRSSSASVKMP